MLIGTSFGTVSAVGIPLVIIGKAAGINLGLLGGAIFSGAYFGDRTSPLSSSLLLLCNLTNLKLFDVSMKQSREFSKPISLGDGYLLENGEYTKIKTIKYD